MKKRKTQLFQAICQRDGDWILNGQVWNYKRCEKRSQRTPSKLSSCPPGWTADDERDRSPSPNRPRVGVWLRSDSLILLRCFGGGCWVGKGREEEAREKNAASLVIKFWNLFVIWFGFIKSYFALRVPPPPSLKLLLSSPPPPAWQAGRWTHTDTHTHSHARTHSHTLLSMWIEAPAFVARSTDNIQELFRPWQWFNNNGTVPLLLRKSWKETKRFNRHKCCAPATNNK